MHFFNSIKQSVYSPPFYATKAHMSLKAAFKYFFLLVTLIILIQLLFAISAFLTFQKQVPQVVKSIVDYYPQELQVQIKDGKATTNVKEPYTISLPKDQRHANSGGEIKNLLVIDTKASLSAELFSSYQTAALLTKDLLVYTTKEGLKTTPLKNVKDITLTKKFFTDIENKLAPWYKFIAVVLFVFGFVLLMLLQILRLLYFLLLAALIMLIASYVKPKLSFKEAYSAVLYAATAGLLIDLVLQLTAPWTHIGGFPFLFTITTVSIFWFNYMKAKEVPPIQDKKKSITS